MAKWPYETDADLEKAGYRFLSDSRCKGCDAMIEWWETPNGKRMPLNKEGLEPHWSTCPTANRFRG